MAGGIRGYRALIRQDGCLVTASVDGLFHHQFLGLDSIVYVSYGNQVNAFVPVAGVDVDHLALLLMDFIVNYPCLCSLSPGHMDSHQFLEEHLDKTLSSF